MSMTITTTITPARAIRRRRSSPSILRLSAVERLAAAAVLIVLIWAAVFWAMSVRHVS